MDNQQPIPDKPRRGRGIVIAGSIILAIGAFLLLQNYLPQITNKLIGPVIIIVIGAAILFGGLKR